VRPKEFEIPQLSNSMEEDAFDQIELLGFPIHSAFDLLIEKEDEDVVLAEALLDHVGKDVWIKGYLIHAKRTTTSNGERMYFGTFLDQKGAWLDTVHFPQIAAEFPFRGTGVYKILGTVIVEYDSISVEVKHMEKMAIIEDPRYAEVRNKKKEREVVTWNMRKDYGKRTNRVE
jgi:DNA polymerase-3 subunit alpha